MKKQPNILFFMTDQMQGRVLDPQHPCDTPHIERLMARGVRFSRAYTPNAVCSPARASLMTGLLPHNHGVLEVVHVVDDDQCVLRTDRRHWAQRLSEAGYHNGYFGKWHVERSNDLNSFGWHVDGGRESPLYRDSSRQQLAGEKDSAYSLRFDLREPSGYREGLFYGVVNSPPENRGMGITTHLAHQFIEEAIDRNEPWCCMVSLTEPHDPFVCGQEAYELYDIDAIELPVNAEDTLQDKPGLYRKLAACWAHMTAVEKKEAMACYWGSISEIDAQLGRLLDLLEKTGQLDDTIVVFTSDHGELLGAHGLYCKNISAFEEVYHIPLVISGEQVRSGAVSSARVGLHDIGPTLLEMVGCQPLSDLDSRSFAGVLQADKDTEFTTGFAEYHGGRYRLTQRIYWRDDWKFIFNGFDYDELYDLKNDPHELVNLAALPAYGEKRHELMREVWQHIKTSGDTSLLNSHYPALRLANCGPDAVL
jgi:arylsulfatase A-like enzyme